jgi:hypothetical protein
MTPRVQIVTATVPDPTQLAAWERLWRRLLTSSAQKGAENTNASETAIPLASRGTGETVP